MATEDQPHEYQFTVRRQVPFVDKYTDSLDQQAREFQEQHPFRPTVPSHSVTRSRRPFLERVTRWKKKRADRLRRQIAEKDADLRRKCTFQPVVSNFEDKNLVRPDAINLSNLPVSAPVVSRPPGVSHDRARGRRSSWVRGQKRIEALRRARDAAQARECTFRPNVKKSTSKAPTPRRPPARRRRRPSSRRVRTNRRRPRRSNDENRSTVVSTDRFVDRLSKPRTPAPAPRDPECTFRPVTSSGPSVTPMMMSNFTYLQRNAFDRLSDVPGKKVDPSQSHQSSRPNRRRASTPARSLASTPANRRKSAIASVRRASSVRVRRTDGPAGDSSTSDVMDDFLKRTASRAALRKKRLKELRMSMAPKYQPRINFRSRRILKSQASFLERMEYMLQKARRSKLEKREAVTLQVPFKPQINAVSKNMKPRSVEQMWRDFSNAKERLKIKREIDDRRKMAEATFHPRITKRAKRLDPSQLGVPQGRTGATNPEAYMQRIRQKQARERMRTRAAQRLRQKEEMEECTFRPKTKPAPRYIRQIAASYGKSKRQIEGESDCPPEPFKF